MSTPKTTLDDMNAWLEATNKANESTGHSTPCARWMKSFLESGADLTKRSIRTDHTPLHDAVYIGNPEIIVLLVGAGADLKARDGLGTTPLHSAATWGDVPIARALIALGSDVASKDVYGRTPLHLSPTAPMSRALIKAGADVNAQDNGGNSPLHAARRKDVLKVLVDAGANPRIENAKGKTPLDHNIYSKNETLRSLLPKTDKKELLESLKDLNTAWKSSDCKAEGSTTQQQEQRPEARRRLM